MQDSEEFIRQQAETLYRAGRNANRRAELWGENRRRNCHRVYPGGDPRNELEALFQEKYGSPTPVPEATLNRTLKVIKACIYYIHYGIPIYECARLCNCQAERLEKTKANDKWEEFAQELMQLAKPSNLTTVPAHDLTILEEEMKRRMGTVTEFREKERQLVLALKTAEKGSMKESAILRNIKSLRDLIDTTLQLDKYHAELSAARKIIMQAAAIKVLKQQEEQAPRQLERGKVVDL